jgi:hypothetical protein
LPLKHCKLPPHAALHEPQLEVSDVVSTHPPSQSLCPEGHAETHLPLEQTSPVGHAVPHEPQLLVSVLRSVQPLLQAVCPPPQMQLPSWQVAPPMHCV